MHFIVHQNIKSMSHAFFKLLEKTVLWREGKWEIGRGWGRERQFSELKFILLDSRTHWWTHYIVRTWTSNLLFFFFFYISSPAVKWGSWWNSIHNGPFFSMVIWLFKIMVTPSKCSCDNYSWSDYFYFNGVCLIGNQYIMSSKNRSKKGEGKLLTGNRDLT